MQRLAIALAVVSFALPAAAQPNPSFEKAKKDEKEAKEVEWKASVQGGLLFSTGNSRNTTFSGGAAASRKQGFNKVSLEASAAYTRTGARTAVDADDSGDIGPTEVFVEKKTTGNALSIKGRYDRFLTEKDAVYGTVKAATDKPAGKDNAYGLQVGYSRLLYKSEAHELAAEVGYDFTYESFVAPVPALNIHSARVFLGYAGKLSDDTELTASGELLGNLNKEDGPQEEIGVFRDTRFLGKLGVTTKLSDKISLRFGFTAKFDAAPAPLAPFALPYVDGFTPIADELDTQTDLQLIITIL
jgi:putative salt-induced outer membrane protein YdiY